MDKAERAACHRLSEENYIYGREDQSQQKRWAKKKNTKKTKKKKDTENIGTPLEPRATANIKKAKPVAKLPG